MNFSSKLLENAVNEFTKFPGVGHKTALRMVLNLLNHPTQTRSLFLSSLSKYFRSGTLRNMYQCKT